MRFDRDRPAKRLAVAAALLAAALGGCDRPESTGQAPGVPLPEDWSLVPEPLHGPIREAASRCERDPHDAGAVERLGRLYHGNEMVDLAALSYETAIGRGSADPKIDYLLGLIYSERGESDAAIDRFRSVTRREPSYAPAHYNLGRSLLDAARVQEAITAFERARSLEPDDGTFHTGLARALRQAGRLDEAEASLGRALEIDPRSDEAHQLMGLTLRAMGREAESEAHLERVGRRSSSVVRDPWLLEVQRLASSLEILLSRAGVYIKRGQLDRAVELLEQTATTYPDRATAHRSLADVYREAGRSQQAVDAYLRAIELEPHDAEAHASLALVLMQHGSHEAAEREAALALAVDPEQEMALVVRATVEMGRGDGKAAIETIRPVLERRDDLAAAHVVHGEALAALGRLDEAEVAFARATELQPDAEYPRRRLDEIRRLSAAGGARP